MELFEQAMIIAFNLGLLALLVAFPLASISALASGAMLLWRPESWPAPLWLVVVGVLAEAVRQADRADRAERERTSR